MNERFWRGKRVFITGNTGFKGGWLTLWLHGLGATVRGYSLAPPTRPSLFELAALHDCGHTLCADVRDGGTLGRELSAFAPDIVLHLAAQSVVFDAYADPASTYATNVLGTVHLLDAVRRQGGRCTVVNVTTDKVYENRGAGRGFRESDPLGGRDPYSSSKSCAELVARSFRESYFSDADGTANHIALASARAGNVVGGGDWTPHQLVPEAVAALREGRAVVLRHPGAVRPWQHVLDCLSGYLTLAEALHEQPQRFAGEWNFGPADADIGPVASVVEMLARHWNVARPWTPAAGSFPHEDRELRIDAGKAARELGWSCRLGLEAAFDWTAAWYIATGRGESPREVCERQIGRFAELPQRGLPPVQA